MGITRIGSPAARGAHKAAGTSRNNTTVLSADPDLRVALEPNRAYAITLMLIFDDGSVLGAADLKYDFNGPAGAALFASQMSFADTATTVRSGNVTTAMNQAKVVNVLTEVAHGLLLSGVIVVGATPGVLEFRWAQNVSDAGNLTIQAGSFLLATPL